MIIDSLIRGKGESVRSRAGGRDTIRIRSKSEKQKSAGPKQ